jgi:triacylglycerol lipase
MDKSFDAVFHPEQFPPMPKVRDLADFERKWVVNRAAVLANMAHAAYLDETNLKELIKRLGASDFHFFDEDGAQAFLAVWPDKAILAFRGSEPKDYHPEPTVNLPDEPLVKLLFSGFDPKYWMFLRNDVLADLKFKKLAIDEKNGVEVHSGFLGEVNKLWGKILDTLKQETVGVPVWVTGHSLGAAMATISSLRYPFEEVVTFGEPRVGCKLERAFRAKRHIRYVNGDDPVTRVPPERPFGFDHHGKAVLICDPDGSTDVRYDHSIVYYAQNL